MSSTDSNDDRHTITSRDLLQLNGTILAAVLILLSIAASSARVFTSSELILAITIATVPFISSCDILLTRYKTSEYRFRLAKIATGSGLIGLVTAIGWFLGAIVNGR